MMVSSRQRGGQQNPLAPSDLALAALLLVHLTLPPLFHPVLRSRRLELFLFQQLALQRIGAQGGGFLHAQKLKTALAVALARGTHAEAEDVDKAVKTPAFRIVWEALLMELKLLLGSPDQAYVLMRSLRDLLDRGTSSAKGRSLL